MPSLRRNPEKEETLWQPWSVDMYLAALCESLEMLRIVTFKYALPNIQFSNRLCPFIAHLTRVLTFSTNAPVSFSLNHLHL